MVHPEKKTQSNKPSRPRSPISHTYIKRTPQAISGTIPITTVLGSQNQCPSTDYWTFRTSVNLNNGKHLQWSPFQFGMFPKLMRVLRFLWAGTTEIGIILMRSFIMFVVVCLLLIGREGSSRATGHGQEGVGPFTGELPR
ncbi:hypothetical protein TNIN_65331 [Trichonephila inaurata madagascariensis]|uniref:Uncharacterized protein n=1 Tax=Trichonephila inaurata madagascariensis TaxID=2747483 RepID=A0A8X6YJV5_9ARAC|nr:hypothetical protein TNIN_65331 [Trichonephila inaurata madagascariensis]